MEADDGYQGELTKVHTAKMLVSESDKRAKKKARARHETVTRQFNQWGCLQQTWRHDLGHHYYVFTAVAVCTHLCIENGEPLFQVSN